MGILRSALRRLRSRRLAVVLIGAVTAYSFVATLVPQTPRAGEPAVSAWQAAHPQLAPLTRLLDLHAAFSSPLFLAAAALLGLSTAACSWERTLHALRAARREGRIGEGEARRLRENPDLVVRLTPGGDAEPLEAAARALRPLRLRVRRGPRLLEASSGRLALIGSPLFHWALTALFVVVAFGRLTRSEGMMGVPVGFPRADATESYRKIGTGPLYPGHSGLTLVVTDLRPFKDADGVDRGVSPYVSLRRGDEVLKEQRVYPNNPLRYGSLLVHSSDYGLAAVVSVETSAGEEVASSQPLLDFAGPGASRTESDGFDITDANGATVAQVTLSVPLDTVQGKPQPVRPARRRAEVSVRGSGIGTTTVLPAGASLALPTGYRLKLKDVVYYARLSVADDWSVYPMYALFVLAALSLTLSLTVPGRRVLVLDADGALHVLVRAGRVDSQFAERVEEALRGAATPDADPEEEVSA